MTKRFGPWIKFNGKTCPVNPDELVRVQLGGTLNLGEQPAKNLNWDAGVITAYRILGGGNKLKTQEEKFLQLMMDDTYKKNPFKSKGININTLDFDHIVKVNPEILKEFICYSYGRLQDLPSLSPDSFVCELMEVTEWLKVEEISNHLKNSYKRLGVPLNLANLPFSVNVVNNLIDDFNDLIDPNNQYLLNYIVSIEKIYKDSLSYKI